MKNRVSRNPFLLVASFLQPHDICEWLRINMDNPARPPYPELDSELPPLPDNFAIVADERGCPAAECLQGDACSTCGSREYVDDNLQCVPCNGPMTCADGEPTRVVADGVCTMQCP